MDQPMFGICANVRWDRYARTDTNESRQKWIIHIVVTFVAILYYCSTLPAYHKTLTISHQTANVCRCRECVPDSDRCSNMGKCNESCCFCFISQPGWYFIYKPILKFKHLHSMQLCWKQNDRNAALYFRIYICFCCVVSTTMQYWTSCSQWPVVGWVLESLVFVICAVMDRYCVGICSA